jgi:2-oxo-3-hexenedioate decarboxylase
MDDTASTTLAAEAAALLGTGRQVPPFTSTRPDLDLTAAYRVAAQVRRLREARGERAVGRKVGFTNRALWAEFGVGHPAWGWMYDATVIAADDPRAADALAGLPEPRIEPEIVLGLSAAPTSGMDAEEILRCVGWVAHAFEIVQSPFPGWRFRPADTVAAFGLHGALLLGPRREIAGDRTAWGAALASFEVDLLRDGAPVDHGHARNVLDGPLQVLRHLADLLAHDSANPPLAAGEMISTGTLTRALPVAPGETWETRLRGIDLPGLAVRFR